MAGQAGPTPERRFLYECLWCGHRLRADAHPGRCPECAGTVQHLHVGW